MDRNRVVGDGDLVGIAGDVLMYNLYRNRY